MTVSAGIRLPLASVVTVPRSPASTEATFSPKPEGDRQVAQVELQRLDDLGVAEVEHAVALLDDGHAAAERGEHRRRTRSR
jgi:hypothetical protein